MEVSCQLHDPAALPPRERAPGTHSIGGWVGPREGLDTMVKVKSKNVKLSLYHAMKTYWGSGGIAPRILDLGIRWR
jgi:hypothetical protein